MGNWDAVAAIAGAGATVVAVSALAWQMRQTRRTVLTSQASRVVAWIEQGAGGRTDLVVHNYSDSLIFAVETAESSVRPGLSVASFILPDDEARVPFDDSGHVDLQTRITHPVRFIDARGLHWTWWGSEGVPADPANRSFKGAVFERRRRTTRLSASNTRSILNSPQRG